MRLEGAGTNLFDRSSHKQGNYIRKQIILFMSKFLFHDYFLNSQLTKRKTGLKRREKKKIKNENNPALASLAERKQRA